MVKDVKIMRFEVAQEFTPDGRILLAEFWHTAGGTGHYSRTTGPAVRYWYESGYLKEEQWCLDNQLHRLDGPALIEYSEEYPGMKTYESWLVHGKPFRHSGPTAIWYDEKTGDIIRTKNHMNTKTFTIS